jgi:hypothetical protein
MVFRHGALVRTDVSEGLSAYIIRMTRIGKLGTTYYFVPRSPILVTPMMEVLSFSETSVCFGGLVCVDVWKGVCMGGLHSMVEAAYLNTC